jgi:hypothetical protein
VAERGIAVRETLDGMDMAALRLRLVRAADAPAGVEVYEKLSDGYGTKGFRVTSLPERQATQRQATKPPSLPPQAHQVDAACPARIALEAGGGLGDILMWYFEPGFDAGYLQDIKERYPDTFVRLTLCSTNPHSKSFFEGHPHIDEVVWQPFVAGYEQVYADYRQDCLPLRTAFDLAKLTYAHPAIHLDVSERDWAKEIASDGPFIALHPFAGDGCRSWLGHVDVQRAIDVLCNAGHRVLLLGGSSTRHEHGAVWNLDEAFSYERLGLINLINRASVRLQADLVLRAQAVVGSLSAYLSLAASLGARMLLVTDGYYRGWFAGQAGVFGKMVRAGAEIVYWDELATIDLDARLRRFAAAL